MSDKRKLTADDIGPYYVVIVFMLMIGAFICNVGFPALVLIASAFLAVAIIVIVCLLPSWIAWAVNKFRGF